MCIFKNKAVLKQVTHYLLASAVLFIFQVIYHYFSHGVVSNSMRYAFLVPFFLGVILNAIIQTFKVASFLTRTVLQMMVSLFTVGLILKGVFEIYGAPSNLVNLFIYAGFILFILWIASSINDFRKGNI